MTRRKHQAPKDRQSKGCVTVPPRGQCTLTLHGLVEQVLLTESL